MDRRVVFALAEVGVLLAVLVLLIFTGHYSEGMFIAWLSAVVGVFAVLTTGTAITGAQTFRLEKMRLAAGKKK